MNAYDRNGNRIFDQEDLIKIAGSYKGAYGIFCEKQNEHKREKKENYSMPSWDEINEEEKRKEEEERKKRKEEEERERRWAQVSLQNQHESSKKLNALTFWAIIVVPGVVGIISLFASSWGLAVLLIHSVLILFSLCFGVASAISILLSIGVIIDGADRGDVALIIYGVVSILYIFPLLSIIIERDKYVR